MMYDLRLGAWRAVRMATVVLSMGSMGCSVFRPLVQDRPSAAPTSASAKAAEIETDDTQLAAGKVSLGPGKWKHPLFDRLGHQSSAGDFPVEERSEREMHLRWVGFRGLVGENLLDEEARRLGISREELYRREVIERVTPPSQNELKRLYDANRARFQGGEL